MSATVPALIVSSVMPHPPISGGHKRTLRLMEAIARAGAIPHLLTVDRGQPSAADELRARGWRVDVPVEAPPSLGSRLRQHAARRPGQYLTSVDRRLRELTPDAVLAVSEHDRSYFSTLSDHVLIAPNGVDAEFFELQDEVPDNHDILFFANYNHPPNADGIARFLSEGWPRLAALDEEARLLLAGGEMPDGLATQADREARVVRLGFVADLPDLLRRSRLVVVPLWHGGGTRLKVLEALASARPVVGTPLGVEQIGVVDGRHAVIAQTPGELADEAASLLADPERSMALGREGRDLAQRFRWDRALAGAEELYRGWIREGA